MYLHGEKLAYRRTNLVVARLPCDARDTELVLRRGSIEEVCEWAHVAAQRVGPARLAHVVYVKARVLVPAAHEVWRVTTSDLALLACVDDDDYDTNFTQHDDFSRSRCVRVVSFAQVLHNTKLTART